MLQEQRYADPVTQIGEAFPPSQKTADAVKKHDAIGKREYSVRIVNLGEVDQKCSCKIGEKQPLQEHVYRRNPGTGLNLRRSSECRLLTGRGLLQGSKHSCKINRYQQKVEHVYTKQI